MFVLLACASGALVGCKSKHPLIGLHCEGGVRDGKPDGGDCIDVKADKRGDAHPDAVGSAVIVSAFQYPFSVRRTSNEGKYALVFEGEPMGVLEHSDSDRWLRVTFTAVPKGSSLATGKTMAFRDDLPGFLR